MTATDQRAEAESQLDRVVDALRDPVGWYCETAMWSGSICTVAYAQGNRP